MRLSRLVAIASVYSALVPHHVAADKLISGFDDFVSWYRSHGGTLDERVTIGYEPGTSIRGMIATAPIPAGTILMHTPASIILSGSGDDQCLNIAEIAEELEAGDQSKWHAYFEYDDSSGDQHIPTQWDRSNGSGRAMDELQGLPPSGDTHRHIDWYRGVCKGGKELTDSDWKALMIFLTRSADIGLIPMYDLMNHHNGRINTKLKVEADESNRLERSLSVVALTDISEGEPIFNTYARSGMESSVDVFNTYGFVDPYPQLWRWTDDESKQLVGSNKLHVSNRYRLHAEGIDEKIVHLQFVPNSDHHEVLVISPTLAALLPTKHLSEALGNAQRTFEEWEDLIAEHHANLLSSHAQNLVNSAKAVLDALPTTVEEDEQMITFEKRRVEKETRLGKKDVNDADAIMAIEYRLAFKKALKLIIEVGATETFMDDTEEEL